MGEGVAAPLRLLLGPPARTVFLDLHGLQEEDVRGVMKARVSFTVEFLGLCIP